MATETEVKEEVAPAVPALWLHVEKTWKAMSEQANEDYEFDGRHFPLYRGFVSNLILQDLGIPVPYYGKVLRILNKMKCVQQVKRGGGPAPSEWVITGTPTLEVFTEVYKNLPEQVARKTKQSHLSQQVRDIKENLGGIDVPQALADIVIQIEALKGEYEEHLITYHDTIVA